jgi:hypothetical protein
VDKLQARFIWGTLLIIGGLFLLLQTLNIVTFQWLGSLFGFLLFAAAGVGFMLFFLTNQDHWWAIIPGCIFLSLATLVGLDGIAPRLANLWGGPIFLGGISLAFWLIYLIHRQYWWAIIPGGVLLTLAAVAGLDQIAPALDTGGIFFLGMAATFFLVYLAPSGKERMSWALIPAAVFLVLGIVVWGAMTALLNYLMPLALIVIGLFLIWRNYTTGEKWPVKSEK